MSISLHPALESKLRARAEAEGLTVEAYLERVVEADEQAESEITALALEGLNSGEPIQPNKDYWEEKHRSLEARLRKTESK
jgi:hypothetical protein